MALGPKWGKMAQKWRKNRKMTPNPNCSPFLGHFFPISGRGPFSIFSPIFSHFFGFRPVFHSIPGGLTRKTGLFGATPELGLGSRSPGLAPKLADTGSFGGDMVWRMATEISSHVAEVSAVSLRFSDRISANNLEARAERARTCSRGCRSFKGQHD